MLFHRIVLAAYGETAAADEYPKDDGYRGIWFTLGQPSEYGEKISGGLGTYTANSCRSPSTPKR